MASDNLNEVGKYIRKTGRNAEQALKRFHPIRPKVERTRDVFDPDIPFEMTFETSSNDNRVSMDLYFNKPPPLRGCKAGCLVSNCQSFNRPAGNHLLNLGQPYSAGSLRIFISQGLVGNYLDPSQYDEVDPDGGEVYVQGAGQDQIITVCYLYSGDCPPSFRYFRWVFHDTINLGQAKYIPAITCSSWHIFAGIATSPATAAYDVFHMSFGEPDLALSGTVSNGAGELGKEQLFFQNPHLANDLEVPYQTTTTIRNSFAAWGPRDFATTLEIDLGAPRQVSMMVIDRAPYNWYPSYLQGSNGGGAWSIIPVTGFAVANFVYPWSFNVTPLIYYL